jgi:phage/plasmid-like protein (TIGR03299 family)
MAHLIDMTTGSAAIAFKGATPWHGLGADMGTNTDMSEWRKRAGLNWEALTAPCQFEIPGHMAPGFVPDRKVLYRSDTNHALSVVGSRYQIVQPVDVIDFYKDLCSQYGFEMETAGALKGGRIIWALAATGENARISGNDAMKGYVLMSTSFDGTMATSLKHTSVRVVCNNTLQMSNADKSAISFSHSTTFNADKARTALGIGGTQWADFVDQAQELALVPVTPTQSVEFFMNVYHGIVKGEQTLTPAQEKSVEKTVKRLVGQYLHAPGADLKSASGTAWGLVNAVTHDIDFERRARNSDNRLTSAWYGDGASIKAKAWEAANALIAA